MNASGKPNQLFIVCEHFSALADPVLHPSCLEMPNFRRLAASGTSFAQACCNAPVCGPSRMTILSGLLPCHHGAYDNGSTLASHVPTYAHVLNAAGYETAICGRMHIHGLDPYKGFEQRIASEIINPMVEQLPDWPAKSCSPPPPLPRGPTAIPEASDAPLYGHDEYVTRTAIDFLRQRGTASRPFHLTVGYFAAHPGARPNPAYRRWHEYYLRHPDLPVAPFTESDYDRLPENARRLLQLGNRTREVFNPEHQRRELAIHFAGLSFLDDQLGQLLAALDDSGLADKTVLCFVADHGENMGRHGLWGKMNFYEEALRVPMVFAGPGIAAGRRIDAPVCLADILPTFAGFAGAEIDIPCDGISLHPLLMGRQSGLPDRPILSEYHGYLMLCGGYMLRKGPWKLIHYPSQQDELYDLENDPGEFCNLAELPRHAAIHQSLLTELLSHIPATALERRIADYNRQRAAVMQGITSSEKTCRRLLENIEQYRRELDEPWWDGGEYMKQWEAHLYRGGTASGS